MRAFEPPLWQLGEASIAEVELDPGSRDDIPQLLLGLQHLYITPTLREEVFGILDGVIPEEIDRNTGRPGMALWRILVLGQRFCSVFRWVKLGISLEERPDLSS